MRKNLIGIAVVTMIFFGGCATTNTVKDSKSQENEYSREAEENIDLALISQISKDTCGICGTREDSLMPYYRRFDSVGVLFLNSGEIGDTRVRSFEDDGTEIFETGASTLITSNDAGYRYTVHSNSDRGISTMDISYDSAVSINYDFITNWLCQDCLDSLEELLEEEMDFADCSEEDLLPFVFLNFRTGEMHSIGRHMKSFLSDDYYVEIDHEDDKIELLVFYAPVRSAKH